MALSQNAYALGTISSGTESELIERLRSGDQAAIEEIFHAYYGGLCRFTLGMTRSRDDVEDLVQDIFVRLWTNREVWSPKGTIKTYLFKAARNQSINFIKSRSHRRTSGAEEQEAIPSPPEADPVSSLYNKDASDVVNAAIERLPERCRLVFTLNRHEDMTYAEIADVLGISEKTVENQMSHALKTLRKSLRHLTL